MKAIISFLAAASMFAVAPPLAAQTIGVLEDVARFDGPMPTGVTVASSGRVFVNYPRWGDDVPFTVAEIKDGKATAYPNEDLNRGDPSRPADTLLSVQSVVADGKNRLWILDTAAPGFQTRVSGGAKLVAVDLATDRIVRTIVIPDDVALATTYVNDVRFDLRNGDGVAYITDSSVSGPGGIIVVDLGTGRAVRRLTGHPSTSPDPLFKPVVDGREMLVRPKSGPTKPFRVASDGIAISPDGETLYYCPLSSRRLYAVPTSALRDPSLSDADLAAKVTELGEKGASDGLETDDKGRVYAGDYENNAVRRLENGAWTTILQDDRVSWPDTFSISGDGFLYFTANQLHRQAGFNEGVDLRRRPYHLYRVKIGAGPVVLK
ncbi:L-dopachrome tautomerase-related protein [Chenggangzhangella methanolivorans]|uniref:L-dopachrome tautomerase-related protein n=1 Tax=Chenggangzhangella methanolivorans TaxID=1437009 RepID=UPI00362241A6